MAPSSLQDVLGLEESDRTTYEEARHGAAVYLQSRLDVKCKSVSDEEFKIPVVDLTSSFSPSLKERQSVANQIREACTTSGFFYITGHGVSPEARQGILKQAERFVHELPTVKKEALHLKHNKFGLGWEPSEYTSIAGDQEQKEVFNFAYEQELDRTGGDGLYRNLDGSCERSNMWPSEDDLPGFRAAVKDYYGAVRIVYQRAPDILLT